MKIIIYFIETNAYKSVVFVASDGRWLSFDTDSNGLDTGTGIDLYEDNAVELLRSYYENAVSHHNLNSFDSMFYDFGVNGNLHYGYNFSREIDDNELTLLHEYIDE